MGRDLLFAGRSEDDGAVREHRWCGIEAGSGRALAEFLPDLRQASKVGILVIEGKRTEARNR
jgi:hypothetical protein